MSDHAAPVVRTEQGEVVGLWRGPSAAFLGIPFAEPPVGERALAAPVRRGPWQGLRDATRPGATPQRRPLGPVTTIPEPSIPGDDTLLVNVFTPAPGDRQAHLPVLVWVHGGGFLAGSPSSPWYDGRSFNRDDVVTVSVSYRLGFDGFGWVRDAPQNRGLLDIIAALEWVQENIGAFGGDPDAVTLAGQSAGAAAVLDLLSSRRAAGLFRSAISQSGLDLTVDLETARRTGLAMAGSAGVAPTRDGWAGVPADRILDLQGALGRAAAGGTAAKPPVGVWLPAALRTGAVLPMPFVPVIDGEVLEAPLSQGLRSGHGRDLPLLIGGMAQEFNEMGPMLLGEAGDREVGEALEAAGVTATVSRLYLAERPWCRTPRDLVAQLVTEVMFRLPILAAADARGAAPTWAFDVGWAAGADGRATHCRDLPFSWDLLGAPGVPEALGADPPQQLATEMHAEWVRFISTGTVSWEPLAPGGQSARIFDGVPDRGRRPLRAARALAEALGRRRAGRP